jgi:oxygen-dependent protoporphyrinogen oxidase
MLRNVSLLSAAVFQVSAAAHRPHRASVTKITLLEASARLGAPSRQSAAKAFVLERGPDSFISEKPEALHSRRRLGLESRLIQTNEALAPQLHCSQWRLRPCPKAFHLLAPSRNLAVYYHRHFHVPGKLRMPRICLLPKQNGKAKTNPVRVSCRRRLA